MRLPIVTAYSSHFFQRYNERFLHQTDLTPNEIAGWFFVRNPYPILISLNEEINKNFNKYGDYNGYGAHVQDGFCFTRTACSGKETKNDKDEHHKINVLFVLYTTFINEHDMNVNQRTAIRRELFRTWFTNPSGFTQ